MIEFQRRISSFFERLPEPSRPIVNTAVLGLGGAGVAIAFLLLTNGLFALSYLWFATFPLPAFLAASFAMIMGTSAAVGVLLGKLSPDAAGSGIPQLKAAYWKDLGYVPIKSVAVKFVAGVLSIGGGTSLGREGPTVFMGGGIASWLSGFTGHAKQRRRTPALVGASAGLAAAFNTPLAAITFVLEEIVGDISSRSIGRVLLSSVVGAFAVYAVIGSQPAFQLPALADVTWVHYLLAPLVAAAASFLGVAFHKQAIRLRGLVRRRRRLPAWAMPMAGGLVTWCLGSAVYAATGKLGVFGLGYLDLSSVLRGDFAWWIAGILVAAKLVATIASYAFGGCGGIFSPLLFVGGLAGYFIANLAGLWLPLAASDKIVLAAVGMSTCLGTVVKAPLSAMLIVFEMTHQFALVPALIIGIVVSMMVSRRTGAENFYDAVLVQDGHELHKVRPPQDLNGWRNLPLAAIANERPVVARSLAREELAALLERHPYACFPYAPGGRLEGLLVREEVERALAARRKPPIERAITCPPEATVGEAGGRFVESRRGIIVLTDGEGAVKGLVTLHDVLRAQAAATE